MGAVRPDFIKLLDEARDQHCRDGFECAKKGHELPAMPDLDALCACMGDGAVGAASAADPARFWEERRQRLKDAIHALGLVEPSLQKMGSAAFRTGSPCKASALPRSTPNKLAAAPTPSDKKRKVPPTPTGASKKAAASALNSARPTPATPRRDDDALEPPKPARPASKDIKQSQWDTSITRRLMAANQFKHDLSKDYVMPLSLPTFNFNLKPRKKK